MRISKLRQRNTADCFKCCLAYLLDISYEEVPDFFGDELTKKDGSPRRAWHAAQDWLGQRGLVAIELNLPLPFMAWTPYKWRCIISGSSPRVEGWDHSVVGEWTPSGLQIIFDPHESNAGVKKRATVTFLVKK